VSETFSQTAAIAAALQRFCAAERGRAAAWCDLETNARLGAAADIAMPAASVVKIAMAMAVADKFAGGALDPTARVAIGDLGGTRYCSILKGFDADSTVSLRELVRFALITSDNPIAVKLMDLVSFEDVNAAMRVAGVSKAAKVTAGFSEAELGPANRVNLLTANDALALLTAVAKEARYEFIRVALENNLRNTRIPRLLPDHAVIAHKTGSLAGVVNDVGIVTGGKTPFVLAFLSDGQSDPWATETAIAECSLAVWDAMA
jgi:beta-lactamase class A